MSKSKPKEASSIELFSLAGLPKYNFGRYTDNNKTAERHQKWFDANQLFREKNYTASIIAFFQYLYDADEQNVRFTEEKDGTISFELLQGSRRIYGKADTDGVHAHCPVVIMKKPSVAAMRKMLELNYKLTHTRCSLTAANTLCLMFDTNESSASPTKLYKGLRELALNADEEDESLLNDFSSMKALSDARTEPLPKRQVEVLYTAFQNWIKEVLLTISRLNPDEYAGAFSYALLGTLYRIDFLLKPESMLQSSIQKILVTYWKDTSSQLITRNDELRNQLRHLELLDFPNFKKNTYRSHSTFGSGPAGDIGNVRDSINQANKDMRYFIDNKLYEMALRINEYGMLFPTYHYSLPLVCVRLIGIYMTVLHTAFFQAFGLTTPMYFPAENKLDKTAVEELVASAIAPYTSRYPKLLWNSSQVNYAGLLEFCLSYSRQVASLNLDEKSVA